MRINFSIQGEMQISRTFMGVKSAIRDWTPALSKSAEDLIEIFSYDVFETEGQALGDPWLPLSPAYALRKERLYPGKGILDASGTMRDSFTQVIDTTSLIIGNAATYFKYHQSNAPRKSNLPRRMMLYLTENMREMVVKNFQIQLQEQAGL